MFSRGIRTGALDMLPKRTNTESSTGFQMPVWVVKGRASSEDASTTKCATLYSREFPKVALCSGRELLVSRRTQGGDGYEPHT
jgi:hypothetical protein